MAATKTQLLGGAFQDSEGNPLALGYLKMKLSQDASVSGVGNICSGLEITIQLDVNGNVVASPAQSVWANTGGVLAPINTFYKVTGYTAAGQRAWGPNNQQVAAGATFNLGSWVPNQVIQWFPSTQQILLEVNGVLAQSQVIANFTAGAGMTITDLGGGEIEFASGSSLNIEVNGTPITSTNPINFEGTGGVVVSNPSAGNVLIAGTGGGVLGKWSGNWIACNASGVSGGSFSNSNQFASFVSTGSNSGDIAPNATQPQAYPIVLQSSGFTDSYSVSDQFLHITPGILTDWFSKVMVVGIISSRYWFGLSDSTDTAAQSVMNSDAPAANVIAFRWDSGVDTNFQAICQTDATHQTKVNTGIAPNLSTPQIFEIVPSSSGTVMNFYINGALVATISTNVPATTTNMGSYIGGDGLGSGSSDGQWYFYYTYALLNS